MFYNIFTFSATPTFSAGVGQQRHWTNGRERECAWWWCRQRHRRLYGRYSRSGDATDRFGQSRHLEFDSGFDSGMAWFDCFVFYYCGLKCVFFSSVMRFYSVLQRQANVSSTLRHDWSRPWSKRCEWARCCVPLSCFQFHCETYAIKSHPSRTNHLSLVRFLSTLCRHSFFFFFCTHKNTQTKHALQTSVQFHTFSDRCVCVSDLFPCGSVIFIIYSNRSFLQLLCSSLVRRQQQQQCTQIKQPQLCHSFKLCWNMHII